MEKSRNCYFFGMSQQTRKCYFCILLIYGFGPPQASTSTLPMLVAQTRLKPETDQAASWCFRVSSPASIRLSKTVKRGKRRIAVPDRQDFAFSASSEHAACHAATFGRSKSPVEKLPAMFPRRSSSRGSTRCRILNLHVRTTGRKGYGRLHPVTEIPKMQEISSANDVLPKGLFRPFGGATRRPHGCWLQKTWFPTCRP